MNWTLAIALIFVVLPVVNSFGQTPDGKRTFKCEMNDNPDYLEVLLRGAISKNDEVCTRQILKKGIRPNGKYKNYPGTEPIRLAAMGGTLPGIIDALFQAGLDPFSEEVRDALFRICATGQSKLLESMVYFNVPVDSKAKNGDTALMFATSGGDLNMVKLLIKKGADPNAKTITGLTPLITANEEESKIRLLLDSGARINDKDKTGQTAIFYALKNSQKKKLELLLKNGADPNVKDLQGNSPLEFARQLKESDEKKAMIELLICLGAKEGR